MSKPTAATKRKYNKSAYHRHEFSVKIDTRLEYILEQYKEDPERSLSELIRNLLCQHFGVEPDEIYVPYHLQQIDGKWIHIPNDEI